MAIDSSSRPFVVQNSITPRIEEFFNSWCDGSVDHLRTSPLLSSLGAEGEFVTSLRERVAQAQDLLATELAAEPAEVADEIGVRAAQSRLAYLLAVAADHGIDVAAPVRPVLLRASIDEMAR
jgi:hypothetical protein